MNYLTKLNTFFENAMLHNKKFIIIPPHRQYYYILTLLNTKNYIKNFMYINSYILFKAYILIEFNYVNGCVKKFKILIFKNKLKFSIKFFKNILKLFKFSGLFLFSTPTGILTLEQLKFFKIGGILILYIYKKFND